MAYKRKKRILKVIRKSALTGRAVWVDRGRTYKSVWENYKNACKKEFVRMNQWTRIVARRKKNVTQFLDRLTEHLPILGDIPQNKRDAARSITLIVNGELSRQSDFYEHVREERRLQENARLREKRWRKKYGKKHKDKKT